MMEQTELRLPWKTAAIVAVDLMGGFSKDGNIPWHYSEDFMWFQHNTQDHICVMGRATYDDINTKMGERGADEVLPGRECYVVTSSPLARFNAIPIPSIAALAEHRTEYNALKTVFFIGGERIYKESALMVDEAYVTIVNTIADCDRFFPVEYMAEHFKTVSSVNASTFDGVFTALRRISY
jgi:dihydrofolate reductase